MFSFNLEDSSVDAFKRENAVVKTCEKTTCLINYINK